LWRQIFILDGPYTDSVFELTKKATKNRTRKKCLIQGQR
jgi:hypothetical protein